MKPSPTTAAPADHTNASRAEDGAQLVALQARRGRSEQDDAETNLTDALANLMHFAEREGIDFEQAIDEARGHHAAELRGEP